jgi:hypothetical protein
MLTCEQRAQDFQLVTGQVRCLLGYAKKRLDVVARFILSVELGLPY